MEKPVTRISVRNLVEFILRSGDLDSRRGTMDKEAMLKGSRLHRKLQKQMDGDYRAEVALKRESSYEDLSIQVKAGPMAFSQRRKPPGSMRSRESTEMWKSWSSQSLFTRHRPCVTVILWPWRENLSSIGIQMTYANLDTEEIKRFREVFSIEV